MAKKKLSKEELLMKKLSALAMAKFATKSETGTDFATEAECRSIVTNYGQQQNENS